MSKRTVYLAGPILGCTYEEANDWRTWVSESLKDYNIMGVSPLRCEPYTAGGTYQMQYDDARFGTAKAICSKNIFDTKMCDMVLAYLPLSEEGYTPSYGTVAEIAWAYALGKSVIVVTDDPAIYSHPVISGCASWMLGDLEEAMDVIIGVLGIYAGGRNV
jgi:nucleoside 2-deoxyribosyltransferase